MRQEQIDEKNKRYYGILPKKLKLGGYYDSRAYYWNNLCYIN